MSDKRPRLATSLASTRLQPRPGDPTQVPREDRFQDPVEYGPPGSVRSIEDMLADAERGRE